MESLEVATMVFLDEENEAKHTSIPGSPKKAEKDEEYWLHGEYLVFQAENTLFRVPSHQFIRNSDIFKGMLSLPRGSDLKDPEGVSSTNPICVPSTIRANDFRNFLKAIYPLRASDNISTGLTKEELESVLKLSTMWYFPDFRREAITRLSPFLTPAEKIATGRAYKVSQFMIDGFLKIITRDEMISDAEAALVDPMTAVALLRIRELRWNRGALPRRSVISFPEEVERQFGHELNLVRQEEEGYKERTEMGGDLAVKSPS